MGQATVDLPDPLSASTPVSSASTDDLLAQLAGEEIERLLADSEEPGSKAAPPPDAQAAPERPTAGSASAPVSSLLEPPSAPVTPSPAEPANPDAQLDALFAQLQTDESLAASAPAAPAATSAAAVREEAPSAAEALAQEMLEDAASSPARLTAPDSEPVEPQTGPTPLYLRALGWISRPLDAYPDSARELIGKIAILTTVNAAAVLAYVVFMRGR